MQINPSDTFLSSQLLTGPAKLLLRAERDEVPSTALTRSELNCVRDGYDVIARRADFETAPIILFPESVGGAGRLLGGRRAGCGGGG